MLFDNKKSDIVSIYSYKGEKISEIELPEKILTIPTKRGGIGDSGIYYKGSGSIYRGHNVNQLDDSISLIGKTGLIYEKYAVQYTKLIGLNGIFTFKHQPVFSDFEGGCGPKERRVLENIKTFEMTSIEEIVDVIPTGIEEHDIYAYKYKNVSGNVLDLQELMEYVLHNNFNTAWDKNLISDIEGYKFVRDLADWYKSDKTEHKFGTIFAFLYSLYNSDIYGYVRLIKDTLGSTNTDRRLIIYFAALLTDKYCPHIFEDKDIDIYELNEEEYGKLFNLLFSGKACCHLEDEERWGYVRNEFKITIGNTVKRNWEKIVQIYSV